MQHLCSWVDWNEAEWHDFGYAPTFAHHMFNMEHVVSEFGPKPQVLHVIAHHFQTPGGQLDADVS